MINIEKLTRGRSTVLFDGAMGTECQKRGLPPGSPPEMLNLQRPESVKAIHRDYIVAGSNVIQTNTFGGNRPRLKSNGLQDKIREINRAAAEMALSAAGNTALVAGSVGPLGELIEPYGVLSRAEAKEVFAEQVAILLEHDIQFILIETMISLEEALIALEGAHHAGAKTIGVTLTFEPTPNGPRTVFGESVADTAQALVRNGAMVVGSNCGSDFATMRRVAQEFRSATERPILIQANAGIPSIIDGQIQYPEGPANFGAFAREIQSMGVHLIGGCCGTTQDHLADANTALGL